LLRQYHLAANSGTEESDRARSARGKPRRGRSAGPDDYDIEDSQVRFSAGTKALMIGEPKGDALSEAMQSWQLGWGNQLHGVLTQEFESRRKGKHPFLEAVWHTISCTRPHD